MADDDCIFCAIARGDGPAEIVDSDERTVAFMDINPGARGHALVIPRAHARDLHTVSPEDLAATMETARRLAGGMRERLDADGVNLLNAAGRAAWQTVFHFHVHVLPRWEGDPIELPWRPTPGDPEEIAAAAAQLRG